jgi:4-amino-4-deoxy-L-arabinose transferase-like glycosyltransferase
MRRRDWTALGGLLIAGFFLLKIPGWKANNPKDLMIPDSVEYAVGAYHLAADKTIEIVLGHHAYPSRYSPGYPVFIAASYLVTGLRVENAVYASLLAALIAAGVLFLVARRFFDLGPSAFCVLVLYSSILFIYASQTVMADILSCALAVATFFLCLRIVRKVSWGECVLLGCVLGSAFAVRNSSICLFPCAAAALWPTRKKITAAAATALGALPFFLALFSYNRRWFGTWMRTGYAYWVSNRYETLSQTFSLSNLWGSRSQGGGNLVYYLKSLAFFFPFLRPVAAPCYVWSGLAVILLSLIGLWSLWTQRCEDMERKALFSFGLVWIVSLFILYGCYFYRELTGRFFLEVIPFIALFSVEGALWVRTRLKAPWVAALLAVLLVFRLVVAVDWNIRRLDRWPGSPLLETMHWLKDHTEPDAVIISGFDGVYMEYFVTGGTRREYIPCGESVEYRGKYIQPLPPQTPGLIPGDSFFSRPIGTLDNGAQEALSFSAVGDPVEIGRRLVAGKKVYMDQYSLQGHFLEDYYVLQSLFDLKPVATVSGRSIFILKLRIRDFSELKRRAVAVQVYLAGRLAERGYAAKASDRLTQALRLAEPDEAEKIRRMIASLSGIKKTG